jgi:hypothetical protein
MNVEELKAAFDGLSLEDKRRFMEAITLDFCQTMMADAESFKRMLCLCMDGPGPTPEDMPQHMQERMAKKTPRRKR